MNVASELCDRVKYHPEAVAKCSNGDVCIHETRSLKFFGRQRRCRDNRPPSKVHRISGLFILHCDFNGLSRGDNVIVKLHWLLSEPFVENRVNSGAGDVFRLRKSCSEHSFLRIGISQMIVEALNRHQIALVNDRLCLGERKQFGVSCESG